MELPEDIYEMNVVKVDNEKIEERLQAIITLLQRFQTSFSGFINSANLGDEHINPIEYKSSIDEVAKEINSDYWDFVLFLKEEKYIVDKHDKKNFPRINIYKIISATEFSIIKNQPIAGQDARLLNAYLAFYFAVHFYKLWFQKSLTPSQFREPNTYKLWDKFFEDRLLWLSRIELNTSFPFFLNSQVWMLLDMITKETKKDEADS